MDSETGIRRLAVWNPRAPDSRAGVSFYNRVRLEYVGAAGVFPGQIVGLQENAVGGPPFVVLHGVVSLLPSSDFDAAVGTPDDVLSFGVVEAGFGQADRAQERARPTFIAAQPVAFQSHIGAAGAKWASREERRNCHDLRSAKIKALMSVKVQLQIWISLMRNINKYLESTSRGLYQNPIFDK